MSKKNIIEDIILDNNDDIEIEYNEDFSSEKTKSLTKFPTKITKNDEFNIDNSRKNFSKSLNFNFRQCFAPKVRSKKSSKKPTPIFKKNKSTMNNQEQIITEDYLSEKGSSLYNDSFEASDLENNNEESNIQNNIIFENKDFNVINNEKNNNEIQKKDNNIIINKNIKCYEHKTISFLQGKVSSNKNSKDIKRARMELLKTKYEALGKMYKETEYKIKENNKNRYNLDLIQNSEKYKHDNEYKVIKINDIEDEDEEEDMSKFRTTISFTKSKFNKANKEDCKNNEIENKGYTIYEVLRNNKKNN